MSLNGVPAFGTPPYYRNPYPAYRAWLDAGQLTVRLSPHLVGVTHYRDCLDILRDARLSAKRHLSANSRIIRLRSGTS